MIVARPTWGRWVSLAWLLPAIAGAAERSSADYRLTLEAVSAGGGSAASSHYGNLGLVGDPGGVATAGPDAVEVRNVAGFVGQTVAVVAGRRVFYNQSVRDGNSATANAADDGAVATDKRALLPGGTATFSNYTSYSRGINGLMVDIAELAGTPGAGSFALAMGNDSEPSGWATAPAPGVSVRWGAGAGGSDRVTLVWGNGAIRQIWLQTTVLADAVTGLGASDLFYFGNAIGETGNDPTSAKVTAADALRVLGNVSASAGVENAFDINRDGKVGAADRLVVLGNLSALAPLQLIDLGTGGSPALAFQPGPAGVWNGEVRTDPRGLAVRWIADGAPVRIWTTDRLSAGIWELYDEVGAGRAAGEPVETVLPLDVQDAARIYRLDARSSGAGASDGLGGTQP